MQSNAELLRTLRESLPGAGLRLTPIPGTSLELWLLDPDTIDMRAATRALADSPPYWAIAWPAGVALARLLMEQPELVRGKRVLDFGAGSGIAALAAAKAGAVYVAACDVDVVAHAACRINALTNQCNISTGATIAPDHWDVVLTTDVLYDADNLAQVQSIVRECGAAIVGDCRFRGAPTAEFQLLFQARADMIPSFGDAQFESVQMYVKQGYTIQPNH